MEASKSFYEQIEEAATVVRESIGRCRPQVALILGSGLGAFADELVNPIEIAYAKIPHFSTSSVVGHEGKLVIGECQGMSVAIMKGRIHYYEGHDLDTVTLPIRVLLALGIKTFIITNAAGGIRKNFTPGDIVLLEDHINLHGINPLRGVNDDRLGPRFPDLTTAYHPSLREVAKAAAKAQGIDLKAGVYLMSQGPSYETPAEIKMMSSLGADVVGMSTVPETIVVNHGGGKVLGLSCVTNLAAGISGQPLSHEEVTQTGQMVQRKFSGLLLEILGRINNIS